MSYDRSFGRASRSMHFGPPGLGLPPNKVGVSGGLEDVGVLGLNAIRRIQLLTGLVPGKANEFIKRLFEDNDVPEEAVARHSDAAVEVGDFVLALGDPGQVVEIEESNFGYRSYRVLYLAERPLPEIDDDWFPAQEIRPMMRLSDLTARFSGVTDAELPRAAVERLAELGPEEQRGALTEGFKSVWDSGLREWVHANWFRSGA